MAALGRLLFVFLFRDADHELFRFWQRNDLLHGEKQVIAVLKRCRTKAFNEHAMLEQPKNGGCHLLSALRGNHDEALIVSWI